jgi:hypothetical protein
LEAVQRLCDTEAAQNGATDTRTSTSDSAAIKSSVARLQ